MAEAKTSVVGEEHNDGMSQLRRIDRVATAGAGIALIMSVFNILLMRQPGYRPLSWGFIARGSTTYAPLTTNQGIPPWLVMLTVLVAATALACYGVRIASPYRRTALLLAGVVLTLVGIKTLYSIGFIEALFSLAGLLCLVAAAKRR